MMAMGFKTLIVYYSYDGNTKNIAQKTEEQLVVELLK